MRIEAINYTVSNLQYKKSDNRQKNTNITYKQITDLPRFSNNQYLVNFKGYEHKNTDIAVVKQELDKLFSEPEKLIDTVKYNSYENMSKFGEYIGSEREDISKLALSYLINSPLVFENYAVEGNFHPLYVGGNGATKALLEYISDKPDLKEKILFTDKSYMEGVSALSAPGGRGIWEYYSDKDKEFKEFILRNKSCDLSSPLFDQADGTPVKILNRFKNDDDTLREFFALTNTDGNYFYTPNTLGYTPLVTRNVLEVLKWTEKEKPQLFKEICNTADGQGNTVIDLLEYEIPWYDKKYPFISFFKDKKDIVGDFYLKEIKKKDGTTVTAGLNLQGKPLEFALDCAKDKVKVYKILKDNNKLDILNSLKAKTIVKFFDEVIQNMDKQ